jgi:alcohol dehydrogenase
MASNAVAAVLAAPRTFELQEFPLPETAPEDALLRVEASGLCGTDYEQFAGRLRAPWDVMPIIPGHEVQGRIERIGAEAARRWQLKEGDRVVVESPIPCGKCHYCQAGRPIHCRSNLGYGLKVGTEVAPHLWGGYASHMYLHPQTNLHKAPEHLSVGILSLYNPMANAVRWVWERGGVELGDTVVVEGPGQRGLLALVVARAVGAAQVIVTGTKADTHRLSLARELGAAATIVVEEEDPVERVLELTDGRGADVVLDISAGAMDPILDGLKMARKGGSVILAGLKNYQKLDGLVTDEIVLRELNIRGVMSSSWSAVERSLDLLTRFNTDLEKLCTHAYPIEQAETAVRVLGREIVDGGEAVHVHVECTGTS